MQAVAERSVSLKEAAVILERGVSTLHDAVQRTGLEPVAKRKTGGRPQHVFSLADLQGAIVSNTTAEKMRVHRAIIVWADSLAAWPTDEEIEARTDRNNHVQNVISAIQNRPYRGFAPLDGAEPNDDWVWGKEERKAQRRRARKNARAQEKRDEAGSEAAKDLKWVSYSRNRFTGRFMWGRRKLVVGSYRTAEEAARATYMKRLALVLGEVVKGRRQPTLWGEGAVK